MYSTSPGPMTASTYSALLNSACLNDNTQPPLSRPNDRTPHSCVHPRGWSCQISLAAEREGSVGLALQDVRWLETRRVRHRILPETRAIIVVVF